MFLLVLAHPGSPRKKVCVSKQCNAMVTKHLQQVNDMYPVSTVHMSIRDFRDNSAI